MTPQRSIGTLVAQAMRTFPPVRALMQNAFRVEDWLHALQVRIARRRRYRTIVEPYTGYGMPTWVRVLARVQMAPPPPVRLPHLPLALRRSTARPHDRPVRGWRAFTRIAAGHVPITIDIEGVKHRAKADRGGVIDVIVPASLEPGWRTITLESADGYVTKAPIVVVGEEPQVGIVSDIDDTVMVTALPRPLLAAWNTFVLDEHARTPTPGMNVLYERLIEHFGRGSTPVIYLSTGPWNVAPTLARFLGRNLYPAGPLLLTDWGPTPNRLFRSGSEHKVSNLERLAVEMPQVKWILVGDDGQHDEQIYGDFAKAHPEQVLAVAIRRLSTGEAILAGAPMSSHAAPQGVPVPWLSAPDGAGLVDSFREAGLISEPPELKESEDLREAFLAEMVEREETYDPADRRDGRRGRRLRELFGL